MKKGIGWRLCALFFCLWFLAGGIQASAREALDINLESVRVEEQKLHIYVNDNLKRDKEQQEDREQYTVTLGTQELPVTDIRKFKDSKEAVSYIFLADVSGSIGKQKLTQMKEYLKLVSNELQENDRVCVMTLGNTLHSSGFLFGKENILAAVEEIQGLSEDTNLYYGISEALKLLETGEARGGKKILLVVSDGEDEQATGITKEEVDVQIREGEIPVFTAAILEEGASNQKMEFAKLLGSFARISPGGIHTALGAEDITPKKSVKRMMKRIQESLIITADASGYQPGSGQAYLKVALHVEAGQAEAGRQIAEDRLAVKEAETETSPQTIKQSETQTEVQTESREEAAPFPLWVFVATGIALVAVILAIVMGVRKSKRRKRENPAQGESGAKISDPEADTRVGVTENPQRESQEEHTVCPPEEVQEKEEKETLPDSGADAGQEEENELPEDEQEEETESEADAADTAGKREDGQEESEAASQKEPGILVFLTKVSMGEDTTYEILVKGETKLGRSPEKADYAYPEDRHMSGVHCALTCFDGKLFIYDLGSTNGTQVNGVPITKPYILNCDDIIHIGSSEFRVHW